MGPMINDPRAIGGNPAAPDSGPLISRKLRDCHGDALFGDLCGRATDLNPCSNGTNPLRLRTLMARDGFPRAPGTLQPFRFHSCDQIQFVSFS